MGFLHQAGVHCQVAVAGLQHVLAGLAGGRVGVAVGRISACVFRRQLVTRRRDELHRVRARRQAGEQVIAAGVGGLGGHHVAAGVQQVDGDAGHIGLARVLLAVAVGVQPDAVAQSGLAVQPGVHRVVHLAGGQRVAAGLAGAVDVAVGGVVAARVLRRHEVAARGGDGHRVGAGGHVKAVTAGGVGGGGGDRIARRITQRDGDTADAGLTRVLHAVGVFVFPHKVADVGVGQRQLAEVVLHAVGASHQHDAADDVVGGGAASGGAGRVLAVQVIRRLGLGGGVGAWAQAGELVKPQRVGGGGGVDQVAPVVGAAQRDGHAGDGRLGIAHAVVAGIQVDIA